MRKKKKVFGGILLAIAMLATLLLALPSGGALAGPNNGNGYNDGEGCTPGYWKQAQHFDSWVGYSPADLFSDVFSVGPATSLGDALDLGGGGENALIRHAVAALLNAANSGVSYAYSEAEVIAMVQSAYASGIYEATKDLFVVQNELGCPLN